MAKYTRFDPRNKNARRHKKHTIDKDIRIRRVDEDKTKYKGQQFVRNYDVIEDSEWDESILD